MLLKFDDRFCCSERKSGKTGVKETRAASISAYEHQGEKLTQRLASLAGLELVTIPRYLGSATTGNRTALKLGLQRFNLQLVNVLCIEQVNLTSKSKNKDNSSLFILTDQLITTTQNKLKES